MKTSIRLFHLGAPIIALFMALQPASAVPTAYRFWQEGWPDGGILTGTLVIDETVTTGGGFPGICYYNAVTSFQMHWSGNSFSDPCDWGNGDLGPGFAWRISTHQIDTLNTVLYNASVFIDGAILIDYGYQGEPRPYWVMSTDSVHTQAVADGGATLMFLGIALVCFWIVPVRRIRVKA